VHAPGFILASASPRRARLLRARGAAFTVEPARVAEIDASAFPRFSPGEIAAINACRKAATVARSHPGRWVVGCDTVVAIETRTFGKPTDQAEARSMLRALSGRVHAVISAVTLAQQRSRGLRIRSFRETTLVRFHRLPEREIDAYLQRVHVLDKAGAYALQQEGNRIIRAIRGPADNVIGLPVDRLLNEMARLGISRA
jgi:septum formation protein